MREIWLREDLHLYRSDQFTGAVRQVLVNRIHVEVVFWHEIFYGFDPIRGKVSTPYKYKGEVRFIPWNYRKSLIFNLQLQNRIT